MCTQRNLHCMIHCCSCGDSRGLAAKFSPGVEGLHVFCNECRELTLHVFDPELASQRIARELNRRRKNLASLRKRYSIEVTRKVPVCPECGTSHHVKEMSEYKGAFYCERCNICLGV